jgi:hypothetical protein
MLTEQNNPKGDAHLATKREAISSQPLLLLKAKVSIAPQPFRANKPFRLGRYTKKLNF